MTNLIPGLLRALVGPESKSGVQTPVIPFKAWFEALQVQIKSLRFVLFFFPFFLLKLNFWGGVIWSSSHALVIGRFLLRALKGASQFGDHSLSMVGEL